MNTATPTPQSPSSPLRAQQVQFFGSFGYLHLPGLFATEAEMISSGFDEVFASAEHQAHGSTKVIAPIVELTPKLAWLREDPRLLNTVTALLGPDWTHHDSVGSIVDGNIGFHTDTEAGGQDLRSINAFFHLDPLTRDTGALRFIAGTQNTDAPWVSDLRRDLARADEIEELFASRAEDLPSMAIETVPGDVIIGDCRALHAHFNGAPGRRLLTMNYAQTDPTDDRSHS
jgi:hypothetical protein